MSKIKLGIIGTGLAWERLHYPAIKRLYDKFEIKAICDSDLNKAKKAANEINLSEGIGNDNIVSRIIGNDAKMSQVMVYDDYQVMLNEADIEAVDLMVPISENFEVAKAVINSKKSLIAEKPFAASVESAKKLITLANKNKSKILVAENIRYDEENVLIKSLIEENKIGDVIYFIDNNVTEFQKDMLKDTFASTEWRQHPSFKGGVFLDSAIHHIARHRFLFGNVVNVYASGRPSDVSFSPYSCINVHLTFQNHITGHYSFYMTGKETQAPLVGMRIFGTEGEIYLEEKNCGFVNISYKNGSHEAIPYKPSEGYYQELNNFYDAIRDDKEIVSTPEKELGDIQVIFDILDSIEEGRAVKSSNNYKK